MEYDFTKLLKPGDSPATVGGYEARIYAVDGTGFLPIHGAVKNHPDAPWSLVAWTKNGIHASNLANGYDLAPPKVVRYINFYSNGCSTGLSYSSRDEAIAGTGSECEAAGVRVEYTLGEGLKK